MIKNRLSYFIQLITILLIVSSCIESTTSIDVTRKSFIGGNDNSGTQTEIDTLLARLTSPFTANTSGFCFLKSSIQNFCWGDNLSIAEDFSAKVTASAPLYGKTIEKYSAYNTTSCVIASGKVYCWGIAAIGSSPERTSTIPVAVDTSGVLSGKTLKNIYVSATRACTVDTDDDIYCWGSGGSGSLGHGISVNSAVPVAVSKAGVLNGLTIKSVAMGMYHTCVIASDDKVYCWGSGTKGQLGNGTSVSSNIPVAAIIPGGLTVKAITAKNSNTTCALASDDLVYCWGEGTQGETGDGGVANVNTPTAIDTSGVLSGKTVKSITSFDHSVCAIANDDQAYCWGRLGKMANGTENYAYVPVAIDQSGVLSGLTIKKISIGFGNFCAIASDDKIYCWGTNTYGQLGNDTTDNSEVPVAVITSGVLSGKVIVEVVLSGPTSCARDSGNQVYCWGRNDVGQVGNNTKTQSNVPAAVVKKEEALGKTFKAIFNAANSSVMCAIGSDDQLYCWGFNTASGLPLYNPQLYPMPVYAHSISNVALSNITFQTGYPDQTVCVQTATGDYYCSSDEFVKRFNFGVQFKAVYHFSYLNGTCYLGVNDLAYCTGEVLGTTSAPSSNVPLPLDMSNVGVGVKIKNIELGAFHGCLLATNNKVYCWGQNLVGLLGNGTLLDAAIPTEIDMSGDLSGKTIKGLYVGDYTSCVIASDDKGYCWGYNLGGSVGNGTIVDAISPVAISTTGVLNGKKLRNINFGLNVTCAIADDNLAYCWGTNTNGMLGNGTLIDTTVPVAVDTSGVLSGKTFKGLLIGSNYMCSIASDDHAYCWGANDKGQLGDGTYGDSYVPVAVSRSGVLNNKTVKNLKVSTLTSCVLASDDKAYCWGEGSAHNLGNNTTAPSSIPVEVLYAP